MAEYVHTRDLWHSATVDDSGVAHVEMGADNEGVSISIYGSPAVLINELQEIIGKLKHGLGLPPDDFEG